MATVRRSKVASKARPPDGRCPAESLRGAVHIALMSGNYAAYVSAWTAPYAPLSPAEFVAAVGAFRHVETALLGGAPLRKWQREALLKMGEIATGVDEYDAQLAALARHCESLVTVALPKTFTAAHCELIPRMLSSIRAELGTVDPARIAELVNIERSKPPRRRGPNVLAAALWNEAGLPGKRRGTVVDNTVVAASASHERKRLANRNDDAG